MCIGKSCTQIAINCKQSQKLFLSKVVPCNTDFFLYIPTYLIKIINKKVFCEKYLNLALKVNIRNHLNLSDNYFHFRILAYLGEHFWSLKLLEAIQEITFQWKKQTSSCHLLNFSIFRHVFISSLDMFKKCINTYHVDSEQV